MSYKLEYIKKEIMPKMLHHSMSGPFHNPVDPVALKIPVSTCEIFKQYLVIVFEYS